MVAKAAVTRQPVSAPGADAAMVPPPGVTAEAALGSSAGLVASVGRLDARERTGVQLLLDWTGWAVGLGFAALARHDFSWGQVGGARLFGLVVPVALLVQLGVGVWSGLYRRRWRFGSFEEAAALVRTGVAVTAVLFLANWWSTGLLLPEQRVLPASVPLSGGLAAMAVMLGGRYLWRLEVERRRRPDGERSTRVLVLGAGEAGEQVIRGMLADPDSPYVPVALLDDHPAKQNLSITGVRVMGGRAAIAEAAARTRAQMVVVAIARASAELVREVTQQAKDAGLGVRVLPTVAELMDTPAQLGDLRAPTIADLLGRRELDTDVDAIAGYLTGRRILVTGAGGSIGSELCRQIRRFGPAELVMADRDESALHALQLSMEGRALLDSPELALIDIRDRTGVHRLLARYRPQVVFHAAALKHLPMLENHPHEALRTNILGTLNVLRAAQSMQVERFVNISTDKAADPTSVLGYTKRIAERLTAMAALDGGGSYLSVRFGNVLGSRGSVLETFRWQVAAGGPLTVTHPDVRRYFMSVEEAVELVIQAGAVGKHGQALVLDMGTPVRIAELARQMTPEGDHLEIVYTGLRPGEKLVESLLGTGEPDDRPEHPLISQVDVPPLHPGRVLTLSLDLGRGQLRDALAELARSVGLRQSDLSRMDGGLGGAHFRPLRHPLAHARNGNSNGNDSGDGTHRRLPGHPRRRAEDAIR